MTFSIVKEKAKALFNEIYICKNKGRLRALEMQFDSLQIEVKRFAGSKNGVELDSKMLLIESALRDTAIVISRAAAEKKKKSKPEVEVKLEVKVKPEVEVKPEVGPLATLNEVFGAEQINEDTKVLAVKEDPNLGEIKKHLAILEAKVGTLKVKETALNKYNGDSYASLAVEKLCKKMKGLTYKYETSQINKKTFQDESQQLIKNTYENGSLQMHRGYKQILLNLAFAVLTLGIGYLIAAKIKQSFLPFNVKTDPITVKTDSIKKLDALNDSLADFKIEIKKMDELDEPASDNEINPFKQAV